MDDTGCTSDKTPFEKTWERADKRSHEVDAYFSSFTTRDWRTMLHFHAYSFVATHAHVRREHMPTLPKEPLDRELLQWYYQHLKSWLAELPDTTAPVNLDQMPKMRSVLELHAQMIRAYLECSPDDWPLLYPPRSP